MHDQDDHMVDFAHALRLARSLPDARVHATRGLGHWRVLTDGATVTHITDFLAHSALLPLARAA
ncbi:MAG: hypothetical protein ACT4PG_03790 [Panacagrimonas sp.]